ncbi:hypothetical protein [Robiginitomaculum antarcticum]|uniref:hypothetical protein n=1 Tax=Robiginitomaculum antarcticum TaxID=437507 RepID=UPI00037B40B7|nr:hypothetical protein [Robiginitomaculum antarcticum]
MRTSPARRKPAYEKWAIGFACSIGLLLMAIGTTASPVNSAMTDNAAHGTVLPAAISPPP